MQLAVLTALFLSFASSSLAYLVNVPNGYQGWKENGPQPLEWSRVDTDAEYFAVVLTNQDRTVLPYDIVLEKYVDGTHLKKEIRLPQDGCPTGDHFRVNLVKSADEPNTIYAQSSEFSIKRW
ncbi:fruit-body specific gene D [Macrolepiota fuliginosa MF-IS2]|uniref:Fruit-body specific gene D n=1 Tax=Macrolepiota fuliginosa MF-IS2 TaxID=1400762 RepID=A0A9P5X5Y6_9AGAR|nr:fruit-body specific gene D [Macrolepiota fuliginosa MF-IS2]